MKVNISEWKYKPPTEKIDKWVIYLINADEKIIFATTKDINTVYKYPLDIIQWAIMEVEEMDFSALFFLLYLKKSGIPLENIEKKFIEIANTINNENEKQEMLKGWEEIKKFLDDEA